MKKNPMLNNTKIECLKCEIDLSLYLKTLIQCKDFTWSSEGAKRLVLHTGVMPVCKTSQTFSFIVLQHFI